MFAGEEQAELGCYLWRQAVLVEQTPSPHAGNRGMLGCSVTLGLLPLGLS